MQKERNLAIDYMRALCMLFIILAHVNPPEVIFQLRSFDVVGLVLISAMCMKKSTNYSEYKIYMKKRISRLLYPTYVCITIVIIVTFIICKINDISYIYKSSAIVNSYLLIDGIGYVWIVRILLIIGLISPALFRLASLHSKYFYPIILGMLAINHLIYYNMPSNRIAYYLIFYYVLYTIGYSVIAAIGLRISNISRMESLCLLIGCTVGFVIYKLVTYYLWETPIIRFEKHPPMFDWIAYGTIVSLVLLSCFKKVVDKNKRIVKYICWFSTNSFVVYFAHIYIIKAIDYINMNNDSILPIWWIRYLVVLLMSIFASFIYLKIKRIVIQKFFALGKG